MTRLHDEGGSMYRGGASLMDEPIIDDPYATRRAGIHAASVALERDWDRDDLDRVLQALGIKRTT